MTANATEKSEVKSRSGGRAARRALREAPKPQFDPAPPGQIGGHYKPLTDPQLDQVIDTAFRILSDIGMGEVPDVLRDAAVARGAEVREIQGKTRLCFSRSFTEDIINGACKSFVLHGRDPSHDIEIGGERVYFGTGGAAVQTLDLDTGDYRASTLNDLYDFTRLADQLENISWFTRCCIATEIADPFDVEINTAYALLRGTKKPVGMSFTLGEYVDPIIDMFDAALGGEGRFAEKPFCKAHISPVISPLRYGDDAVDVTLACIRRGVPINAIIAAQSGATAPATLAGMLAHTTAETLAGLIMVNVISPGYPMIFSNWPFVIDLRSGAFCGSGGEISVLNAAAAQISNRLGLPSGVASSMGDAKSVDAQMGMEKALSANLAGLSGANMVYESAGMMASLLGVSFEAFVVDNEMLGYCHRIIRGIEVDDDTLGFEAIEKAVFGDGHFLGGDHTMAAMERDYLYPKLADRNPPSLWMEEGKPDLWAKARDVARELLSQGDPGHLDASVDAKIRQQHRILLAEA